VANCRARFVRPAAATRRDDVALATQSSEPVWGSPETGLAITLVGAKLCDRLLYLLDGKAVFFGPSDELERFFSVPAIEEVYRSQSVRSAAQWREAFLGTPAGARAFADRPLAATDGIVPDATRATTDRATDTATVAGPLVQLHVLFMRYAEIQLSDWKSLLLVFLQAPVIALMVSAVFGDIRLPFVEQHAASTKEVMFVLVLAVLWCAGTVSVREIVKEQGVFRHESRIGLNVLPYAASKILLLGAISIVQALVLLYVVRELTGVTGNVAVQTAVVTLLAVVGVLLGLLVSAVSSSSERAMTLLPVALIAQAIFSGGIAQLSDLALHASHALVSAWWALDGLRSSFSSALMFASYPGPPGGSMRPVLGTGGPLVLDLMALAAQGAVFFAATCVALHWRRS
jgi:ABC transport system ATP-binding/permease protein